eukprot:4024153-Pleurochrysis_carterae.AAC.2
MPNVACVQPQSGYDTHAHTCSCKRSCPSSHSQQSPRRVRNDTKVTVPKMRRCVCVTSASLLVRSIPTCMPPPIPARSRVHGPAVRERVPMRECVSALACNRPIVRAQEHDCTQQSCSVRYKRTRDSVRVTAYT